MEKNLIFSAITLKSFKEFISSSNCSLEHGRMFNEIEDEYNSHCSSHGSDMHDGDYIDNIIGFIRSKYSSVKAKNDFLSIFLSYYNSMSSKSSPEIIKAILSSDTSDMDSYVNTYVPEKLSESISDEEYEKGLFQFISTSSGRTQRIFKEIVRKYNAFLLSIYRDVKEMIDHEISNESTNLSMYTKDQISKENKKIFLSDNNIPVYLDEEYVSITKGVASIKKCTNDDYIGALGTSRFSILPFLSLCD